jgi:hypothetical protein
VSPFGPIGPGSPFGPAGPWPTEPIVATNAPRSFSPLPRTTVNRYEPSASAAGRNTTTSVSVALMTVIGYVSHHTCGAVVPNATP